MELSLVILSSSTDSPCLQIDDTGTKVRANVIRSVIILREIPESTSIEVKGLYIVCVKMCHCMTYFLCRM